MTFRWTGWQDDPSAGDESPYVNWLREACFDGHDEKDGISLAPLPLAKSAAEISGGTESAAPLPDFARPGKRADEPSIKLGWTPDQVSPVGWRYAYSCGLASGRRLARRRRCALRP